MKLIFENWRSFLNEEIKQDLKGQTIVLIGDSQMVGGRAKDHPSFLHQKNVIKSQRRMTPKELRRKESWTNRGRKGNKVYHMGHYLDNMLTARGAKVIRLGRGGWGSKSWNKNLDERSLKYLKSLKPSQIIVNLGQNDTGYVNRRVTEKIPDYFDSTSKLIEKLKGVVGGKNITWFGPTHTSSQKAKKRIDYENTSAKIARRAGDAGINYVNMLTHMDDYSTKLGKDIEWREKQKERKPERIRYDAAHFSGEHAKGWATAISSNISVPTQITPATVPAAEPIMGPEPLPEPTQNKPWHQPLEMPEPIPPDGVEVDPQ